MITPLLMLLVLACVIAVPMTMLARTLGHRLNAMDGAGVSGQVKAAARKVPNTGGIAVFWTIAILLAGGLIVANSPLAEHARTLFPAVGEHLAGLTKQTPAALALLGCTLTLHVLGLIDDRRPLGAWPKLIVMLLVAGAGVWLTDSRLLTLLDARTGGPWLSIVLTVIWIVAVTNAMNFIDNMDGLCGGITTIAGTGFFIAAIMHGQWFIAASLAMLVGAMIGFLVFNYPIRISASIFLGDSGSLVAGFLLGMMAVRLTYTTIPTGAEAGAWYAVLTPLVVLAVPLYDMLSVTAIRLSQGKSPFVGDLQHLSHRLHFRGLSKRDAVIVIHGLTAITTLGGVILQQVMLWQAVLIGVQTLLVLILLAIYEYRASRPNPS